MHSSKYIRERFRVCIAQLGEVGRNMTQPLSRKWSLLLNSGSLSIFGTELQHVPLPE